MFSIFSNFHIFSIFLGLSKMAVVCIRHVNSTSSAFENVTQFPHLMKLSLPVGMTSKKISLDVLFILISLMFKTFILTKLWRELDRNRARP